MFLRHVLDPTLYGGPLRKQKMGEDGYLDRLSDSSNLIDFEQNGIGSLLCNPLLDALWICAKHVVPHYLQRTQVLCQGLAI